jgi:hypothetical protein
MNDAGTPAFVSAACIVSPWSIAIDDMGYLGQLPCLTAKTVNPFSMNGG